MPKHLPTEIHSYYEFLEFALQVFLENYVFRQVTLFMDFISKYEGGIVSYLCF